MPRTPAKIAASPARRCAPLSPPLPAAVLPAAAAVAAVPPAAEGATADAAGLLVGNGSACS